MTSIQSVLHISTYDITGGAARAAYRLHAGLRGIGLRSRMLVRQKASDDPDVLLAGRQPEALLHRAWRKTAPYLDDFPRYMLRRSDPNPVSPAVLPSLLAGDVTALGPDIVNLHWVCGGYVTPEALTHFKRPIVWTLHDEWAFCGAEHYAGSSLRPREGYRRDNRPAGTPRPDIERWVWMRKKKAYHHLPQLAAVAPSRWLAERAKASVLFRDRHVEHIPYGIDIARYHPVERKVARRLLGLDAGKRLLLFGAFGGINNPRKGFDLLRAALQHLSASGRVQDMELIIFGSGAEGAAIDVAVPARALGVLHDDISLALLYAAADVFIQTSLADNLPLTVMEAMACGTPVVSVDVGGTGDLVRDGETGRLVPRRDPAEFAAALDWILTDRERRERLGTAARNLIERECALDMQARRYARLYEEIGAGKC
jgi:glycosyltransferase involved in cell wall biosynthesis